MISARERIAVAASGHRPDKIPVSLWRHFPAEDQDPERLAVAEIDFYRMYQPDWMKLNPSGWYWVEDRGVVLRRHKDPRRVPSVERRAIESAADWEKITPVDFESPQFTARRQTISRIQNELKGQVPLFETLFSPLTILYKLCGSRLSEDLNQNALRTTLEGLIRRTSEEVMSYIDRLHDLGVEGVFYAIQSVGSQVLTRQQYADFGKESDTIVLNHIRDKSMWRIVHLHGEDVFFNDASSLPTDFVGWHMRSTSPSLREGKKQLNVAIAGGIARETVLKGSDEEVRAQALDTADATQGSGIMITPDCTISPETPDKRWQLLRTAMDEAATL